MSRTARNIRRIAIGFVLVIAAAYALRVPLAESLLLRWLESRGIADTTFDIVAFDFDRIAIEGITAGTQDAVRIARIAVTWSPGVLLQGRVHGITVEGTEVRASLAGDRLVVPGIDLPKSSSTSGLVLPQVPFSSFRIEDAKVDIATPYGRLDATTSVFYSVFEGETSFVWNGIANGEPGRVHFAVTGNSHTHDRIDGRFYAAAGVVDTPALQIPVFHGEGEFAIAAGRLVSAMGALSADEVMLPRSDAVRTGKLEIEGSLDGGAVGVKLFFIEQQDGLDAILTLSELAFDRDGVETQARINVILPYRTIAGIDLHGISVTLPLALRWRDETLTVALADAGRLKAANVAGDGFRLPGPVDITLPASETPLASIERNADGTLTVAHKITGKIKPLRLVLSPDGATPRMVTLDETRLHAAGRYIPPDGYSGRTTLANSDGTLDDPALRFTQIEADIKPADLTGNGTALLDIGKVTDISGTPFFRPVGVSLDVTRAEGATRFTAALRDATQTIRATATGPWPLSGPRDAIRFDIPPLAFETGGKQPATLLPLLSAVAVSRGSVSGGGQLRHVDDRFVISADARITDMSFAVAGADVAGLDALVEFDSLLPPTTPAGQRITIRRIDLATPVEDVRIDYRLTEAGGTPRLDIASATARLLGGSLRLRDVAATLDGGPVDLPLAVEKLDVTTMLALLGIEGVDGSGTLSGTLPLRLSPTEAEIRDGHLAADGPGVLRLDSGTTADFLAAQGESVDLAVRALEDFHYTELTIGIARETGGEARLALSMLGANPAVLDGHPFRFNINLKSNVDELIDALLKGYSIAIGKIGGAR